MTLYDYLLFSIGYVRLRNILDVPLIVPVNLKEGGELQPDETLTVTNYLARYLLQTAGFAGRLERVR